jgi:hypothetical protein
MIFPKLLNDRTPLRGVENGMLFVPWVALCLPTAKNIYVLRTRGALFPIAGLLPVQKSQVNFFLGLLGKKSNFTE